MAKKKGKKPDSSANSRTPASSLTSQAKAELTPAQSSVKKKKSGRAGVAQQQVSARPAKSVQKLKVITSPQHETRNGPGPVLAHRTSSASSSQSSETPITPTNSPKNQLTSECAKLQRHYHSKVLRRFYEPMALLYALCELGGSVRGHTRCFNDAERHPGKSRLRRRFTSALALVCDYHKGSGDTVTAVALQSKPDGTVVWLAANGRIEPETQGFVKELLLQLDRISAGEAEDDILDRISGFCVHRIQTYVNLLQSVVDKCYEKLRDRTASQRDKGRAKEMTEWLKTVSSMSRDPQTSLPELATNCHTHGELLSSMDAWCHDENSDQPIRKAKHFMGRLASYSKAARDLVDAALQIPDLVQGATLRIVPHSKNVRSTQYIKRLSLREVAGRMFRTASEASEFCVKVDGMPMYRDLPQQLTNQHKFDTRVHAELLLVEAISSAQSMDSGFDFVDGDQFIGCSKPCCFCCYHYIQGLPTSQRFAVQGTHNKVYKAWRPPDLENVNCVTTLKARQAALDAVTKRLREEISDFINKRQAKQRFNFDSVTGDTSLFNPRRGVKEGDEDASSSSEEAVWVSEGSDGDDD